jgi:hypothetical protein
MLRSISRNKANDIEFFVRMTHVIVKSVGTNQILDFLFDIFSNFEQTMSADGLAQFCETFSIKVDILEDPSKSGFIDNFANYKDVKKF